MRLAIPSILNKVVSRSLNWCLVSNLTFDSSVSSYLLTQEKWFDSFKNLFKVLSISFKLCFADAIISFRELLLWVFGWNLDWLLDELCLGHLHWDRYFRVVCNLVKKNETDWKDVCLVWVVFKIISILIIVLFAKFFHNSLYLLGFTRESEWL
jgi:hypothetical protein